MLNPTVLLDGSQNIEAPIPAFDVHPRHCRHLGFKNEGTHTEKRWPVGDCGLRLSRWRRLWIAVEDSDMNRFSHVLPQPLSSINLSPDSFLFSRSHPPHLHSPNLSRRVSGASQSDILPCFSRAFEETPSTCCSLTRDIDLARTLWLTYSYPITFPAYYLTRRVFVLQTHLLRLKKNGEDVNSNEDQGMNFPAG